jgi:hemoglobin
MVFENPVAAEDRANEEAIELCVRRFYGRAQKDPLLAPIFGVSVPDWDHHISKIHDFWSRVLLGTERYSGLPYPPHMQLPVEPEHFTRWLALFEETARETLSPALAEKAVDKARHMAACFQSGIFPFVDENGRPSRQPG